MNKSDSFLLFILLLPAIFVLPLAAQIPARPDPPRLVNDMAGIFTAAEVESLERTLVGFNDSTSNQIAIVTLESLEGYPASELAFRIGETWGVGKKGFDNGVVILLKPKRGNERGDVFIATGYGLEGAIPDAVCKRIVENEMLPEFRKGDYYSGIVKATEVLMALASGEYSERQYRKGSGGNTAIGIVFLILFILFIIIAGSSRRHTRSIGGPLPFWLAMMLANSGTRQSRGSWGDFTSGGGPFRGGGGFGGGGFGGFGGGSFGGGGAGGSW
jgi:uncharacterized protein